MPTCPNCKQAVFADDIYCGNCGTSLTGAEAQPSPPEPLHAPGIQCPVCGTMNEADAIYCEKDGTPLRAGAEQPQPSVSPPGPMAEANCVFILPDQSELSLTGPSRTFGRSDLIRFLREGEATEVSRSHFTVTEENGVYYVEDGGPDPNNPQAWKPSVNRTLLNGVALQPNEKKQLNEGDVLDIAGLVRLTFRLRQ